MVDAGGPELVSKGSEADISPVAGSNDAPSKGDPH
jgi:hypothetical protein